jgi:putative Holliday junction resolvase
MRSGVRLGVDVGATRIGVARSDAEGILASPVETVLRDESAIERLLVIASELSVLEIFVGLPMNLAGKHTLSTEDAIRFAQQIASVSSVPVRLIDERLTTVSAHSALRMNGKQPSRSRSVVDQVAAVMLLQHALDSERSQGVVPGSNVRDVS